MFIFFIFYLKQVHFRYLAKFFFLIRTVDWSWKHKSWSFDRYFLYHFDFKTDFISKPGLSFDKLTHLFNFTFMLFGSLWNELYFFFTFYFFYLIICFLFFVLFFNLFFYCCFHYFVHLFFKTSSFNILFLDYVHCMIFYFISFGTF